MKATIIRNTYNLMMLAIFSLASCETFLDVQPRDEASDEVTIVDLGSAETALNGAYRSLASNGYYGTTFQFAIYLQGGELAWGDSRTVNREFIQHDVRSDNEEVESAWVAIYNTINQANHIIAKVPILPDQLIDGASRNRILGEAYFIRALAYFDLARTWGGVQLVLTPTESVDDTKGISRSSLAETYAQVLRDLDEAESRLPTGVNRVRATKNTVWALKARFYLYQQDWEQAEFYASAVIEDPNYTLMKPYSSWFANNVVGSRESVFETAYSNNNTNGHRNNWQPPVNGGVRRWFPTDEFISQLTDPAIGGGRKALVAQTPSGIWYGNLYYRNPPVDPSYVIRIAELYLIRAEARANLGGSRLVGALDDLNTIRDRAELKPDSASTKETLLLAIENERRFEFAFEPHRWFDLVRTGRADEVLNLTDPDKYVLPIPIGQILIDPALEQNHGY